MLKRKLAITVLGLALSVGMAQSAFAATADANGAKAAKQTQLSDWKDKTAALVAELEGLRVEQKALHAQINTLRDSNKEALKAKSPEERKALKDSLKSLHDQINAEQASVKALREQKHTKWDQVRAARHTRDADAAVAALEQIIALKEQIIQAKQQICALQQSIQLLLSGTNA